MVGAAGTQSNVFNPNVTGVANYLTLTVLDITNPSNPQILGSTFVTNEQFPAQRGGAKTDVVDLGNGDFAVSDTDTNGNPALLVIDPSNPNNIIVAAAQVPSGVHGITVSGDTLYATTSSGLSIYQIGQLVSDPVTITVNLARRHRREHRRRLVQHPADADHHVGQLATAGLGSNFAAGNTTYTFSWQTDAEQRDAGQTIPVTTGASLRRTSTRGRPAR